MQLCVRRQLRDDACRPVGPCRDRGHGFGHSRGLVAGSAAAVPGSAQNRVSARATLFFPANGTAMELRGASRYEILPHTARPLANAPMPERKALNAAFREIQLDRSSL